MPLRTLAERLTAANAGQSSSADAIKAAATAVAEEIFRTRIEGLAADVADKVAAQYKAVLESAIQESLVGVMAGLSKIEGRLAELETGPGLDSLEPVARVIDELRQEIHSIEIPAPVVDLPTPITSVSTGVRELADYDLHHIRDKQGFLLKTEARVVNQ